MSKESLIPPSEWKSIANRMRDNQTKIVKINNPINAYYEVRQYSNHSNLWEVKGRALTEAEAVKMACLL